MDVGSLTTELVFSRLHLVRRGELLNTHYVVVMREVLYRSPVLLTPYSDVGQIDTAQLRRFVREACEDSQLASSEIETGAIVLTGRASTPENARAITVTMAIDGHLVCAPVGPSLEAALAAHGSGAVAVTRATHETILNVDLGAYAAKLALIHDGEVISTAAVSLCAQSPDEVADALVGAICSHSHLDTIIFSGGIAEHLYGRGQQLPGADFGYAVADALQTRADAGALPAPIRPGGESLWATAIGASQLTVQVNGYTLTTSRPGLLPLPRMPVLRPRLPRHGAIASEEVAQAIRRSCERQGLAGGEQAVALAISWDGQHNHAILTNMAAGVLRGLQLGPELNKPLVLAVSGGYGQAIYRILREELGFAGDLAVVDGVELSEFDEIELGENVESNDAAPVVVKVMGVPRSAWMLSTL